MLTQTKINFTVQDSSFAYKTINLSIWIAELVYQFSTVIHFNLAKCVSSDFSTVTKLLSKKIIFSTSI